jgi:hypothetical protein
VKIFLKAILIWLWWALEGLMLLITWALGKVVLYVWAGGSYVVGKVQLWWMERRHGASGD